MTRRDFKSQLLAKGLVDAQAVRRAEVEKDIERARHIHRGFANKELPVRPEIRCEAERILIAYLTEKTDFAAKRLLDTRSLADLVEDAIGLRIEAILDRWLLEAKDAPSPLHHELVPLLQVAYLRTVPLIYARLEDRRKHRACAAYLDSVLDACVSRPADAAGWGETLTAVWIL